MRSRSLIRSAPAMVCGMLIAGINTAITYLLLVYAQHSFAHSTLMGWAIIGSVHAFPFGAIVAMPLTFLVVLLWVQGRRLKTAVILGLGYSAVLTLIFFDSLVQESLQRQSGWERVTTSYLAIVLLQFGAWPLAAWATYKTAPWFNKNY